VFWPCGLLQSALVVAGLANSAWGGALAMAAFALASAWGLQLLPWWVGRVSRPGSAAWQRRAMPWAVRASGLLLALASAWALGRDIWRPAWDYCFG
jgi:sulfite exporter TauE/SafE